MQVFENVLSPQQKEILSFIALYKDKFILVWWTAIALQLGHRESIDFDLFMPNTEYLPTRYMQLQRKHNHYETIVWHQDSYQQHYLIHGVKVTFLAYMYDIPKTVISQQLTLPMPSLIHLAAMKIHAISKRNKRKDYVDIAFLFQHIWVDSIIDYTKKYFWWEFNLKLFANQLCYVDDLDYSDVVVYTPWYEQSEDSIHTYLADTSRYIFDRIIA